MSFTQNHFALQLSQWHDGQSSGLYAVSSCLLAGVWPMFDDMLRAIQELRREHNTECDKLANTLQLMLECNEEYCATYQKYLESDS